MEHPLIEHLQGEFVTGHGQLRTRLLSLGWNGTGLVLTPTRYNPDRETRKLSEIDLAPFQLSRGRASRPPGWFGRLLRRPPREVSVLHLEIRTLRGFRLRLEADCPGPDEEALLKGLPWMQAPAAPSAAWSEMIALLEQLRGLGIPLARAVRSEEPSPEPTGSAEPTPGDALQFMETDTRLRARAAPINRARIRVALDGSGDTSSVAEAVDWLEPGGTLIVGTGRHPLTALLEIRHSLDIEAEMDAVFVGQTSPAIVSIMGANTEVSVRGLTLEYPRHTELELPGCAMRVANASVTLEGCTLRSGRGGIEISGGSGLTLVGAGKLHATTCVFENNARHGVEISDHSQAVLRECQMVGNAAAGVMVFGEGASVDIAECVMRENGGDGVKLSRAKHAVMRDSICEGNLVSGVFAFGPVELELERVRCIRNRREGVTFGLSTRVRLSHCLLNENNRDGMRIYDHARIVAHTNRCENNGRHGIDVEAPAVAELIGNVATGNRRFGIRVASNTTLDQNTIEDNGAGNLAWV